MFNNSPFLDLHRYSLPLKEAEAMAFSKLDQFLHPGEWTYENWRDLQGNYFLCAAGKKGEKGELVGGLLGTTPDHGEVGHLYKVVVYPDLRRRGGATLLLEFYLAHLRSVGARSLYLEVAINNGDAIKFYRQHGFKDLCVKKKFYGTGEDALSMEILFF